MNEIWLELVRLIPALLWFALAVCLLILFRARLANLLTRLGTVEAMGIKLVCMRESIDAALELAEKAPEWQVHVPPGLTHETHSFLIPGGNRLHPIEYRR